MGLELPLLLLCKIQWVFGQVVIGYEVSELECIKWYYNKLEI